MGPKRKVCVVTGSRADYGLLLWIMKGIAAEPAFELQVAVTGSHLTHEFGMTQREIESDGFAINARVDALVSGESPAATAKSIGLGVMGFGDAFARLQPDIVVLLGDRYEILAAAQAALVAKIPLAHIAGGDVTEGAFDDSIRHSITKLSHLHFVTNAVSEARVRQLGEDPRHVHNVGSPGLDTLRHTELLDRKTLEAELGMQFRQRNLLVTFHPVTLEPGTSLPQLSALLDALDSMGNEIGIVFTGSNADPEGRTFNRAVSSYIASRPNCRFFDSLGQQRYLSVMQHVDVVVGNSSSGIYEAPSLRKPSVNIGDRQKGRLRAASVIDCEPRAEAIAHAVRTAFALDCSSVENPYGDGHSAERIIRLLRAISEPKDLVRKRFVDA